MVVRHHLPVSPSMMQSPLLVSWLTSCTPFRPSGSESGSSAGAAKVQDPASWRAKQSLLLTRQSYSSCRKCGASVQSSKTPWQPASSHLRQCSSRRANSSVPLQSSDKRADPVARDCSHCRHIEESTVTRVVAHQSSASRSAASRARRPSSKSRRRPRRGCSEVTHLESHSSLGFEVSKSPSSST